MLITCCKSKELERGKEETKREFRGNSDDFYFMLIRPIYRLIMRRPKPLHKCYINSEKAKSLYNNDIVISVSLWSFKIQYL